MASGSPRQRRATFLGNGGPLLPFRRRRRLAALVTGDGAHCTGGGVLVLGALKNQKGRRRWLRWLWKRLGGHLRLSPTGHWRYSLGAKLALRWLWRQLEDLVTFPWQRRRLAPLAAVLGVPLPRALPDPTCFRRRRPPAAALQPSEVLGYGDFWVALPLGPRRPRPPAKASAAANRRRKPQRRRQTRPGPPQRRRWGFRQWMEWLAGVIDGDGHLRTRSQKRWRSGWLVVAGNSTELALLGQVRRLLRGGTISPRRKGKGRSYTLAHSGRLRRFLKHCAPLLRNPVRREQALTLAARLGAALTFSAEPPSDAWRAGLLETDGYVGCSGLSQTLVVGVTNTQREVLEWFGVTFAHSIEPCHRNPKTGKQVFRCYLKVTPNHQLRRVVRRLGVVPSAGPKGVRLRLLPRSRGLRRAGAHLASADPTEKALWAALWRRWRALRGVAKRKPGDPPLDPRFCRLPLFRAGGPRPVVADRRRLAFLAAEGLLGLRRRGEQLHLLLSLAAQRSGDQSLLERLRRWLGKGSWRRCRQPVLELRGAATLHRLALLLAPHWRRAHRRWRRFGRPAFRRRRQPRRWTAAELRRQLQLQLAPLAQRRSRQRRPS